VLTKLKLWIYQVKNKIHQQNIKRRFTKDTYLLPNNLTYLYSLTIQ